MFYIGKENFEYMQSKYVRPTAPVETFNRFQRVDEHFAEDSGMAPDEIMKVIT